MPRTFLLDDPTMTGNTVAHRLHSTLGRGCDYVPDDPWQKGEGSLVDDRTGHVFAKIGKANGRKVIEVVTGREDFLPAVMAIATETTC